MGYVIKGLHCKYITSCFSSVYKATEIDEVVGDILTKDGTASPTDSTGSQEILSKISVPNNQVRIKRKSQLSTDICEQG